MMNDKQSSLQFAKALADETRQQIMGKLCCTWLSVNELTIKLDNVSQPTVSHHLRILREAGLVHTRRDGKQIFYSLNQEMVALCCGRLLVNFAPEQANRIPEAEIGIEG